MSDKNKHPHPVDDTPSAISTVQDKINQKILALRLKKEAEAEARKTRAQEKVKPKKQTSIDTKQFSLPPPVTTSNWKVPFSEKSQTPPPLPPQKSSKSVAPKVEAKVEEVNVVKPKAKGILALFNPKTPEKSAVDVVIQSEDVYHEEFDEDETPEIILLSKPGSRNIVKTITFEPPAVVQIELEPVKSSLPQIIIETESLVPLPLPLQTESAILTSVPVPSHHEVYRYSNRPLAITRGTNQRQLEQQRLISNNKTTKNRVNESLLNVLRSGKDEATHVTVIPADEAKVLELELKQWKHSRITFLSLFGVATILGITIVALTLYSSINYFILKAGKFDSEKQGANMDFILHTDFMIIGTVFLSAIGILVFRLFPDVKKRTVVRIHVGICCLTILLFIYGFGVAISSHDEVTGGVNEHMYTLHAMVGLMICGFLLWEIGTGIYLLVRPTGITKYHSALGMMTFMLSGACCVSGYLVRSILFNAPEAALQLDTKNRVSNTTGVLIIVFCCFVRYIAADFRFRRRSQPEWDTVFSRSLTSLEDYNIDREGSTLQEYVRRNIMPRAK